MTGPPSSTSYIGADEAEPNKGTRKRAQYEDQEDYRTSRDFFIERVSWTFTIRRRAAVRAVVVAILTLEDVFRLVRAIEIARET
jgi:hypothetical protein